MRASPLKNSTLRLLNAIVTLDPFLPKHEAFGARKEVRNDPQVSEWFVAYAIFLLIDCLTPSPVAGPEDPDRVLAVRKPDR